MKNSQRGNLQPRSFHMEHLEQRHLLSAVPFSTGSLDNPDEGAFVQITLGSTNAPPDASAIVQIHVESANGSALDPGQLQLVDAVNGEILFSHMNFEGTSSYALARLVLNQQYTLLVQSEGGTTGDYNIFVQVAGDANGDGAVSEVEWRSVEAAVMQSNGFSSGLAQNMLRAYGIDLYKNSYYRAEFDTNGNNRIDASELSAYVTPNYYLTTQDGVKIVPDIITDNTAPELAEVQIEDKDGNSVDTPAGVLGAWDGPWEAGQHTDLATNAVLDAGTGFVITGKIHDGSGVASANGAFTYGGKTLEIADMLQNQGNYYTYDAATNTFELNVVEAFAALNLEMPVNGFAEGEYVLKMWAEDTFGNKHTDTAPATITVTIDRTAPLFKPEIDSAALLGTVPTTMKVTFDNKAVAGDYVQIWRSGDAGRVLLGTAQLTDADILNAYANVSVAVVADGEYTYYARSIDLAGNFSEANVSQTTIRIDTTAPEITTNLGHDADIETHPGGGTAGVDYTYEDKVNLSIVAEDATAMTFVLYHDGTPTDAVYNTTTKQFENIPLNYGLNDFYVKITDAAGNSVESSHVKLQQNDVPTVVEENKITAHTQAMQDGATWTVNLAGSPLFADVNIAAGDSLTFGRSFEGDAVQSVSFDGTTLTVVFNAIPESEIRLAGKVTLTATDSDGEVATMAINVVYTKDDVAPAIDHISLSPGGFRDDVDNNTYYTAGEAGNFIINGEIYDVSEILEIYGKLYHDGQEFDISGLLTKTSGDPVAIDVADLLGVTSLADGEYVLKIWGVDSVGNVSSEENPSVTYTFVLDTQAPAVAVDSLGIDALYTKDTTPEITIQLDTTDNGLSGFWVEIIGTGPTPVYAVIPASAFTNGKYAFSPDGALVDGEYVFTARTISAAGVTTADCNPVTIIVDTVAPIATEYTLSANIDSGAGYPNYTSDKTTSITVFADDVNPVKYMLYAGEGTDGTLLQSSGSYISDMDYTFGDTTPFTLEYGANVFTVVLLDEADNQSELLTFTITHNLPPAIIGGEIANQTISANETYTMEINIHDFFEDENAASLSYEVLVTDNGNVLLSKNYNETTGVLTLVFKELQLGEGPSVVSVSATATDVYGKSVADVFTATCSLGNSAPKWVNGNTLESGMYYTGQTGTPLKFNPSTLITDAETPNDLTFADIQISFGGTAYTVGTGITDNGDGTYSWMPPVNYYGGGTLSITVTDAGANDLLGENEPVTVTLTKAILIQWENYVPVLEPINPAEHDVKIGDTNSLNLLDYFNVVHLRGTWTGTGYATDPEDGAYNYWNIDWNEADESAFDAVPTISNGSSTFGLMSYDFKQNAYGEYTFTISTTDNHGAKSNEVTFKLTVYPESLDPVGVRDTVSFQVSGAGQQQWNILANDSDPNAWQDLRAESLTLSYGGASATANFGAAQRAELEITVDGQQYTVYFSISTDGQSLILDMGEIADLTLLDGEEFTFSYVLSDDGTLPAGFSMWYDETVGNMPRSVTVSGNAIQFNAYAKALTYDEFVANSHADDYDGPITDILTKNAANWGDKTFKLQPGGVFDIYQNSAKAGEAVVLADGTLEIQLPGNAFGQYTLVYTLVNTAEASETASATLTLNVNATNAEAPVYTGNADSLKYTINEGGTLTILVSDLDNLFSDYETPAPFTYSFTCSQGTFVLNAAETAYVFTPNAGLWDADIAFTVTATDTVFGEAGNLSATKTSAAISGSVRVNAVVAAPTVDSSETIIVTGSTQTINLKDYITNYDSSLTYTYTVNTLGLSGTLVKQSEGVYVYTPADGFFGSNSFTFNVTVVKGTASESANNNTVNLVVAGTIQLTDESLVVNVDTQTLNIGSGGTLENDAPLDQAITIPVNSYIASGSVLVAGTTIPSGTTIPRNTTYNGITYTSNTRLTESLTLVGNMVLGNDMEVVTAFALPEGTVLKEGTQFGAGMTIVYRIYSLNTDLFDAAKQGTYPTQTFDLGEGLTNVAYTLKENSFIHSVNVTGGKLVVTYLPYSPSQDRSAQDITITLNGAELLMKVATDHVQPLQYFMRIVSAPAASNTATNLSTPDTASVKTGTKFYIEVWTQNDNPLFSSLYVSLYPSGYAQANTVTVHAEYLNGLTSNDVTIKLDDSSYGYGTNNWEDPDPNNLITKTEDGFVVTGMFSMFNSELAGGTTIYASGVDGTYARVGAFSVTIQAEGELKLSVNTGENDMAGNLFSIGYVDGSYNAAQMDAQDVKLIVSNSLPIYGTQSARETVVEGTGVYMTVSKNAAADAKVDTLPANEQWLTEWDSYYVNLWVNTQDPNVNLESLLFDLKYNANYISATGVEYTAAIDGLEVMYSADGAVIGIGGTLLADLTNEDGFILIGRVKMESLPGDNVAADTVGSVKTGLTLDNIQLTDKTGEAVTPNTQVYVNTNVYAVVYDINDSGQVDIYDLIQFSKNYGDKSIDSLNPVTWAIDFDNSGQIDIYDLIQFSKNYGAGQGGTQQVVYPEGFMQRWIGSQFLTEGDASVNDMLDVVIRQWQDALGEQFQLDVQIIVKDIGDSTLGETVLVSLDDAGKPAVAVIYLDASALGLGWYVSEDAAQLADSGRYDLYTVLAHELGHALGFNPLYTGFIDTLDPTGQWYVDENGQSHVMMSGSDHLWDETDLMYYQIAPGVRKEISTLDAEIVSKARENGGELVYIEKISILGEASADALGVTVATVSSIVEEAQWTRTLEEKVVAEIQREAQLLTAAALLADEDDGLAVTPAEEADALQWLELSASAAPVTASAEAAADLLLGDWESFLEDGENGEDADDLPLTLDAE